METIGTWWMWAGFFGIVLVMLAIDLFVVGGGKRHRVSVKEAAVWSGIWVIVSMTFAALLWAYLAGTAGREVADEKALEYVTGYLIEKSLAIDNVFVWLMLFSFFHIPLELQKRVLVYGVLGAIVMRTGMIFAGVWATVVYFPVASWVFNFGLADDGSFAYGGWITKGLQDVFGVGVIDFAGGTAVHINAGAAALALALVLGKRVGFAKGIAVPHNPPFVLLGAGLLWFGWFGFNAGSELAADGTAAVAFVNTLIAPAAALLAWLVVEKIKDGKPTSVGAASGAVAGLVAITPACGSLTPGWALVLGALAGIICALAIDLKFKLGFDDSLDVVGVHLVGGLVGTLFLGFFANGTGLVYGASGAQLLVQAIAAFSVLVYSFVLAFVIGFIIEKTIGFRIKNEDELAGVDLVVHGEEGYVLADTKA